MASNGKTLSFGPWQDGVEIAVNGDHLYFRIKTTDAAKKAAPDSKSGKSKLLANSHGWQGVPGGLRANVMVSAAKD